MASVNLLAGWVAALAGVVSGAVIGLNFHRDNWFGGYDAFRRRMLRLGHISFFGLGFLNLFFGLSAAAVALPRPYLEVASVCLIAGAFAMPACCFLSAWREPFRRLFPIPVLIISAGIVSLLLGWPST